jgi:hypothetical protein
MIWVLLAALGVPLWLVIGALAASLWSRRTFKRAPGTFPAKVRVSAGAPAGVDARWPRRPFYVRWVHDVVLVHHGLALVRTDALPVANVTGPLIEGEPAEITRLGPSPIVLTLHLDDGTTTELAGRTEDRDLLVGPYAAVVL